MSPIEKAINKAGSVAALAALIGEENPQTVQHWRKRGVPADKCLRISQAVNGAVTCHELRPDVFPPEHAANKKRGAA